MKIYFLIICCFLANFYYSQIIEVKNIVGEATISGKVSPSDAKIEAINNAKIKALQKAGIEENISSYQNLYSNQKNNDFTQFFSSDIQSEMRGAVKKYEIIKEEINKKSTNELVMEITINAEVIKYNTMPDYTYKANLNGIKSAYNKHDNLTFEISVTQDSYLQIFNITDNEAILFYPNIFEKSTLIKANTKFKIPNSNIDYQLDTDKKTEINRLIFVFTKSNVPYLSVDKNQNTTQENIFSWIYSLPPDIRTTEYKSFILE
jgi:hypothetical protein